MDDRTIQFRVGVLVLATAIIASILIARFGDLPGLTKDQYTLYVRFPQAPGVTADTPVYKSGILIGRVVQTTLLDDGGGVVVTLKIDGSRVLKSNEICRIGTSSILGDAMLEFVPSGTRLAVEAYGDGDYLDGIVAQDPLRVMESATTVLDMLSSLEEDVRLALVSIEGAGQRVGDFAVSLAAVIDNNQDQVRRILTKAEKGMDRFDETVDSINRAASSIDTVFGDEELRISLQQALDVVPQLITDSTEVLDLLKGVAARADQNLRNLEGITEPFGERGLQFADAIQGGMEDLDTILSQLVVFTEAINNKEGSLGQLIHSRDLYDRLNDSAANIEHLSRRLRPIVEDARVFADKVARDPGRIGVKGILDRSRTGTKR